jgi:peptidoglycan hydrolase CwlO-like protein
MSAGDVRLTIDLADVLALLTEINGKLDTIMTEQNELDTDVANLQADDAAIATELAALKAANPALDFGPLEAAIAATASLAPPPA